jgi:SAM-dependent methyltransferase
MGSNYVAAKLGVMDDHGQARGDEPGHEHGPGHEWDDRYGAEPMWSGRPNEGLVREVSGMPPGTVLDVGCGEGADAVWLAQQGWTVTGLDVSGRALARAADAASAAGLSVEWRHQELEALPSGSTYDLVSVFYPALLRGDGSVVATLLGAVAPGGTLLAVHHAYVDRERAAEHGFDPDDYVGHDDLVAAVTSAGWTVELATEVERAPVDGPGAHHHTDHVLRARRRG